MWRVHKYRNAYCRTHDINIRLYVYINTVHVCVWHVCDTFGIHVHVYVLRNGDPRWRIPHAVYLAGPTLISIYINLSLSRHKPLWSNKQGLYTCVCICVTICVTLCAYIMSVCLMYTLMMCSSHAFPHVAGHLTMTLRMWCANLSEQPFSVTSHIQFPILLTFDVLDVFAMEHHMGIYF